jgi:hypothetical protein
MMAAPVNAATGSVAGLPVQPTEDRSEQTPGEIERGTRRTITMTACVHGHVRLPESANVAVHPVRALRARYGNDESEYHAGQQRCSDDSHHEPTNLPDGAAEMRSTQQPEQNAGDNGDE